MTCVQKIRRWNVKIFLTFFTKGIWHLVLSDLHRRTDSFYRAQTLYAQGSLFYYLPADWYQAIVIFHSLDVASIRLYPLALFEIDIDDPNSRFRRRYLPAVMYVHEHNTAIVGKRKRNSICRFHLIPSLFCVFNERISFITYVCIVSGTPRRG